LMGQMLAQCPVSTLQDVSSGMLIVSTLLDYITTAKSLGGAVSYVPEVLSFLSSLIACYHSTPSPSRNSTISRCFNMTELACLRRVYTAPQTGSSSLNRDNAIPWSWFIAGKLKTAIDEDVATTILCVSYRLVDRLLAMYGDCRDMMADVFQEVLENLVSVHPHQSPVMPVLLQQYHCDVASRLMDACKACVDGRRPLRWRHQVVASLDTKMPRYDPNYKLKKDLTSDQEMSLLKQLRRQLKREKKGTVRELRRDNEFLDHVKYAEKQEHRSQLQEERWKNFAWLEGQQAVMNMHVKRFKGELKGGGSNGVKPVKRREKRK